MDLLKAELFNDSYDIMITDSFSDLSESSEALRLRNRKVCIVTDSNVGNYYLDEIKNNLSYAKELSSFTFEAGEKQKQLGTVEDLYRFLVKNRFQRGDLLVALGGGVTGDLTGFTAATYLRGIDFIQVPTSLLSMVDSSIGGKTGVDLDQYKNMVGAFYQPKLVFINVFALKTLPAPEFASGMAEIIKHGLIKDISYFNSLRNYRDKILEFDKDATSDMIRKSIIIKKEVVEKDPLEQGERALLNFGHTIGHALEKASDFTLPHGFGVALGAAAASYISFKRGLISEEDLNTIISVIKSFDLPVTYDIKDKDMILSLTKSDKKMAGDHIKFILLKTIGDAMISTDVSDRDILEGIEYISNE